AGPLAVGDPVEAPALGVRGVIAAIAGDEAEVHGDSGQRVRIALARLRPTAQEARESVRAFVDDAAVAGLPDVRVVHGRGTGALRKAVRAELAAHPLVSTTEGEAADGATVATLG